MSDFLMYSIMIFFIYLGSILMYIGFIDFLTEDDRWLCDEGYYYFLIYPVIPFIIAFEKIKKFNQYLIKNNLKEMNFRILGKAMGYMFFPTLGVLLMLVVGFFDPVAMWVWVKSNNAWAVFVRIIIFGLEIGLITYLYFYYLKEEKMNKMKNGEYDKTDNQEIYYSEDVYRLFDNPSGNSDHKYTKFKTNDKNVIIIKRKLSNQ